MPTQVPTAMMMTPTRPPQPSIRSPCRSPLGNLRNLQCSSARSSEPVCSPAKATHRSDNTNRPSNANDDHGNVAMLDCQDNIPLPPLRRLHAVSSSLIFLLDDLSASQENVSRVVELNAAVNSESDSIIETSPSFNKKPVSNTLSVKIFQPWKQRAKATKWGCSSSIHKNFPPNHDTSRYGNLVSLQFILNQYTDPLL